VAETYVKNIKCKEENSDNSLGNTTNLPLLISSETSWSRTILCLWTHKGKNHDCVDCNITALLRSEGTFSNHQAQEPSSRRVAYSSLPGLCSVRFWASPQMETPQPLQMTCSRVWPPSEHKSVSWCWEGISHYFCVCTIGLSQGQLSSRWKDDIGVYHWPNWCCHSCS